MQASDIIATFHTVFGPDGPRLEGGHIEPVYLPGPPALIGFREDFGASALHEVAHWCIAGRARRQLEDYGYWYEPARDTETQSLFEQVEAAPQALEWMLTIAAGREFRVSFDHFSLPQARRDAFRRRVQQAAIDRLARGLPHRARRFGDALAMRTGRDDWRSPRHYRELPT